MRGPDHRSVPTTFSVGCVLRMTFWAALLSVAFGSEVGYCIAGAQEKQPARVASPLDRLDPAKIPAAERFAGQPTELVAVIGTGRGRHCGSVWCVAADPLGRWIASGGMDKVVRIWDVKTLQEVLTLNGHTEMVNALAFSPDGKTLVSGGFDNTLRVWDLSREKPKQLAAFPHRHGVNRAAFSPDGKVLVSSSLFTIQVWAVTGQEFAKGDLLEAESGVSSLSFSPDGRLLAAASRGEVVLWAMAGDKPRKRDSIDGGKSVFTSAVFSPDGKTLACGSLTPEVTFWDVTGRKAVKKLSWSTETERVSSVAFSSNGKVLATGSEDGTFQLWDLSQSPPKRLFAEPQAGGSKVAVGPNGKTFMVGSYGGAIRLWDLEVEKITERVPLQDRLPIGYAIAIAPDGKTLATADGDAAIRLWDLGREQPKEVARLPVRSSGALVFSPDGKALASTGGHPKSVVVWSLDGQPKEKAVLELNQPVQSLLFLADGRHLATGSHDVRLWDLQQAPPKEKTLLSKHTNTIPALACSMNGKTFASASWDGTAQVWDLSGDTPMKRFTASKRSSLIAAAMSPDGKTLAVSCLGRNIYLWAAHADKPTEQAVLKTQQGAVTSLCYSPDGNQLLSADDQGKVVLSSSTGKFLHSWQLPGAAYRALFAPDNRHVVLANSNGTVWILRLSHAKAGTP